ncbi:MarR family transcriptional regulator [Nitriliruptoraceae bacterium ZYF776]|nr:MarR family transcriptional regulator [Profundirhabdus halotolerans]
MVAPSGVPASEGGRSRSTVLVSMSTDKGRRSRPPSWCGHRAFGRYRLTSDGVDHLDPILARWHELHPELDLAGMSVLGRVKRLARVLEVRQAAVLQRHGLTAVDVDVLAPLYRAGTGLRPRELRRSMMIGSGTLTPRIDRLERDGYLRRGPDPDDGRGTVLHLTARGREVAPAVVAELLEVENGLLAEVSGAAGRRLAEDLARLLAAAETDTSTA